MPRRKTLFSASVASALRIAGVYALVATIWIVGWHRTLAFFLGAEAMPPGPQQLHTWMFVIGSGLLLYLFARVQFTRRDRLLEALEAERERFRVLVEGVTDSAIYLLDPQGRVTTWNAGAERLEGWNSDAIVGRHFRLFFTRDDVAAGRPDAALAAAGRDGRYSADMGHVRRDGSPFWAAVQITALRHEDGRLRGFACVTRDVTERRATEAALAENERLFRALYERASVGIAQAAPDGRLMRANPHFSRLLGRTPDDMLAHSLDGLTHPEDRATDRALAARCLAGEIEQFSREKRFTRAEGSSVWVNFSVALVRDAASQPAYFICVAEDISPRRAAEEALAATAKQYRLLFAANPLPMLLYDLETLQIVAANDALISSYGYTRDEIVQMSICDIRPSEDVPRLLQAVAELRAGRVRTPIEKAGRWRHRRRDGSIIDVEVASHVVDFEGRHADLVLAHDITARLQAEAEVEESRARLAGIFDSAMDAIITVDGGQRIVLFNRAAEAVFRVSAAEMLGTTMDRLLPERFRADHGRHIDTFADTGVTSRRMGRLDGIMGLRSDGEEFPIEASISQVATTRGRFFTVILRDITERRRAEDALAESRRRLQMAVETAKLGSWDWDLAGHRLSFSPEWLKQLGYDEAEVADDSEMLRSRLHPDDMPRIDEVRDGFLAGERNAAELELRVRHRDGNYRHLQTTAVLMRDAAGRPARVLGTSLDITPIRETERTVRRLSAHILRLQDAERRRIARELHDTTAQNLAALNMNLARLERALATDNSPLVKLVNDTTALADICVQEVRTLSYLLHPPLLDQFGLGRAVQDYTSGFAARSGIAVQVEIEGEILRLPDEVELAFFRVLQESLGNVHRHSESATATVRLCQTATEIRLEVSDNGRGIAPAMLERLRSRAALGVGVTGMAERLSQLGGRLDFDSGPAGTTVRARAPLPPRTDEGKAQGGG